MAENNGVLLAQELDGLIRVRERMLAGWFGPYCRIVLHGRTECWISGCEPAAGCNQSFSVMCLLESKLEQIYRNYAEIMLSPQKRSPNRCLYFSVSRTHIFQPFCFGTHYYCYFFFILVFLDIFFGNTSSLLWHGSYQPYDAPYAKQRQAKTRQPSHPAHLGRVVPPG